RSLPEVPVVRSRPALTVLVLLLGVASARGVRVDGSSTVYPIALAMAEEYAVENPRVEITVAFSGSGGSHSKMYAGEVDVANASRVVKRSELEACAANGVELIELPVAADAVTVVVNSGNDFAQCLTVAELNAIWAPDSTVSTWSDVRPEWPAEAIALYGPGVDSGTFE